MGIVRSSLWDSVKELVLEQYKGSSRLKAFIQSVVEECAQPIEDSAYSIQQFFDVTQATGEWLDLLGKLVNLERNAGETDGSFRERIVIEASTDTAGTPDNVIYNSAILSGDSEPVFFDEAPATFFVYDGPEYEHRGEGDDVLVKEAGLKQLRRSQISKLSPAGVLGLPAAALNVEDLLLVVDEGDEWENDLLLFVADDSMIENELVLSDNQGNVIMASQGTPVRVTIKGNVSVPTIPATVGGVTYDTVRIKDLPDVDEGYMVRDSEESGTGKTNGIGASGMKALWDATEPDEE